MIWIQIYPCQCQDLMFGSVDQVIASRQHVEKCGAQTGFKFHTGQMKDQVIYYTKFNFL